MITLEKVDDLFVQVSAFDTILAKATGVSAIAQTRRIESKLREYFLAKWNVLRQEAAEKASMMVLAGKDPDEISAAVRRIMTEWSSEVRQQLFRDMARIYRLGRESLWMKAQRLGATVEKAKVPKKEFVLQPVFDVADRKAVKAIQEQQLFWISEIDDYQKEIASKIRDVTEAVILEGGGDRVFAGKELRDEIDRLLGFVSTPSGYTGTVESYFEGLAASASTTARSQGQVRSLQDLEVETYIIVNPEDSRTCPICSHMNGKSFTVEIGGKVVDDELAADTPEEVKEAHPFVQFSDVEGLDEAELARDGIVLPPFHFNCRCNLDIDSASIFAESDEED